MSGSDHVEQAEWVPEFPGQRPPFRPGHELSIHHGAHSKRKVDPLAAELVRSMLDDAAMAYLHAPHWRPALWAWARAEAQAQLLTEYLLKAAEDAGDGVGDLDVDRVKTAYLLLHRAETRATTQRTRLGLDPLSAARLGRDKTAAAVDMAQLMKLAAEQAQRDEGGGGHDDDA